MASSTSDALFDLVLDPTLLDLVLSMPDLTWRDIGTTVATLIAWDLLSKPLCAFCWRHSRKGVSWGLFRLALAIDPQVAGAAGGIRHAASGGIGAAANGQPAAALSAGPFAIFASGSRPPPG